MVADCHRILLNDGIFIYPSNNQHKEGKIRLYYEALPFCYIFSLAGGIGLNDGYKNILDCYQSWNLLNIHAKIGVILCSNNEYNNLKFMLELIDDKN